MEKYTLHFNANCIGIFKLRVFFKPLVQIFDVYTEIMGNG